MSKKDAQQRLRYYKRFFFVYALITISIAIVAYFMILFLKEQRGASFLINIAGRERMLLQKMTKEVLLYYSFGQDVHEVHETIDMFEESMNGMLYGGSVRRSMLAGEKILITRVDDHIRVDLDEIESSWKGYKGYLNLVIEKKDPHAMTYVIEHNAQLLQKIDSFVSLMQEYYENRAARMRTIAIVLSNLVILGFAFTIIFQIRGIVVARRALEDVESFVPICSRCKKIRKEHANPRDPASWMTMEAYFKQKSDTEFSHGLCPDCMHELYPEIAEKMRVQNDNSNK